MLQVQSSDGLRDLLTRKIPPGDLDTKKNWAVGYCIGSRLLRAAKMDSWAMARTMMESMSNGDIRNLVTNLTDDQRSQLSAMGVSADQLRPEFRILGTTRCATR